MMCSMVAKAMIFWTAVQEMTHSLAAQGTTFSTVVRVMMLATVDPEPIALLAARQ